VRPTLEPWVGYPATAGLQRVVPEREPLTDEEADRIEASHAEIEALIAVIDDEETTDDARQEAEEKAGALEREIAALRDKPAITDEALRPKLGAFLLLDDTGAPVLDSVFYSEATGDQDEEPRDETGGARADPPATVEPEQPKERPQAISRALVDELAIQRRDVLAAHVAADPALALDLAIFLMVDRDAGYSTGKSGSSLVALPPTDPVFGFKTPDAPATLARAQATEALDRSWTDGATRGERFDAIRALPDEARAAWLSHAVARTLEASANASERPCPFHDHLGALLGIDVAKWWRPTGANYFDRVSKAVTLAALEEVSGPAFASRYSGLKKAELSQSAERIFAGDFIGEVEVKERALAWVPEAMRFAPPVAPSVPADDTPPWEDEPAATSASDLAAHPGSESGEDEPETGGHEPSESIEEAA
jgi:ParB family chromosome partitioning protein